MFQTVILSSPNRGLTVSDLSDMLLLNPRPHLDLLFCPGAKLQISNRMWFRHLKVGTIEGSGPLLTRPPIPPRGGVG
jgi:hypothetical protein